MAIHRAETRQRREKMRDLTRQEILAASAKVFAGHGLEAATMHDIAAAAGFSAASLYTYFPSKEAIYAALLEHVQAELDQPLDEPVDKKRPFAQRIETLLTQQLLVMGQHLDTFTLMMQPTSSSASAAVQKKLREVGMAHMLMRFTGWLEKNSSAKERGNVAPARLALAISAVGQAFVMEQMIKGAMTGLERLAPDIVHQTLYGVLGKP
jgi:AcrR family transcriptional regulator